MALEAPFFNHRNSGSPVSRGWRSAEVPVYRRPATLFFVLTTALSWHTHSSCDSPLFSFWDLWVLPGSKAGLVKS